ncbi:hypothetical protein [Nocardia anaemiae]|uniref:hypothetical protein n=1 Tax=Nocardia anaemiae TaxID=263910 RepID=UPI0007A49E9C|nr:hypothetical protein [Nocardia anaemiae]
MWTKTTCANWHGRCGVPAQLKVQDPVAAETLSIPEQPHGDHAYLAGDLPEALTRYTRELSADPLRPQPWAGLALALPKLYPDNDFGILEHRAEVAAALYQAVRAAAENVEIVDLLRWLSDGTRIDG